VEKTLLHRPGDDHAGGLVELRAARLRFQAAHQAVPVLDLLAEEPQLSEKVWSDAD
jgi:hypothetical protein